jgi:N-acetylneuraminate synthase/N,N'-diacetyllegionaminate synthase
MDGVVTIAGRGIGGGAPCFIVAEAGVNHNGDIELARRLVEAAAAARADAVKFQTFRAEGVAATGAPKAPYQLETTDSDESQLDMLRKLELGFDEHAELKRYAEEHGLVFLSTPFDAASVELLDRLDVAAFKIASPDVANIPLLEDVGRRGRLVILSTGTADMGEVEQAVERLRGAGAGVVVVLHCVTAYPADPADANLQAMATMREALGLPVGYSDHTEGDEVALAAIALGATVLEKHLTLDRSLPGPDQRASLEPDEFGALVRRARRVESSLGDGVKRPSAAEHEIARVVRRSLAAAEALPAGTSLEATMLTTLRPGTGIAPDRIGEVVGRTLRRGLDRGELLDPTDLV